MSVYHKTKIVKKSVLPRHVIMVKMARVVLQNITCLRASFPPLLDSHLGMHTIETGMRRKVNYGNYTFSMPSSCTPGHKVLTIMAPVLVIT